MEGAFAWPQSAHGAYLAGQMGADVRFVLAGVTFLSLTPPLSNLSGCRAIRSLP